MTEEERIRRAQHARQIVEDELYREVWTTLEANLRSAWEATKPMQTAEREELWRSLKTLREVKQRFENFMADGRVADLQIQRKAKERDAGRSPAV